VEEVDSYGLKAMRFTAKKQQIPVRSALDEICKKKENLRSEAIPSQEMAAQGKGIGSNRKFCRMLSSKT